MKKEKNMHKIYLPPVFSRLLSDDEFKSFSLSIEHNLLKFLSNFPLEVPLRVLSINLIDYRQ